MYRLYQLFQFFVGEERVFFMREIVSDERVCRQTEGVNLSQ